MYSTLIERKGSLKKDTDQTCRGVVSYSLFLLFTTANRDGRKGEMKHGLIPRNITLLKCGALMIRAHTQHFFSLNFEVWGEVVLDISGFQG